MYMLYAIYIYIYIYLFIKYVYIHMAAFVSYKFPKEKPPWDVP